MTPRPPAKLHTALRIKLGHSSCRTIQTRNTIKFNTNSRASNLVSKCMAVKHIKHVVKNQIKKNQQRQSRKWQIAEALSWALSKPDSINIMRSFIRSKRGFHCSFTDLQRIARPLNAIKCLCRGLSSPTKSEQIQPLSAVEFQERPAEQNVLI